MFGRKVSRFFHSVITRVIATSIVVVTVGSFLKFNILSSYFQDELELSAIGHQIDTSKAIAQQIENDLALRQQTLERIAQQVATGHFVQKKIAQRWLNEHSDLALLFPLGIAIEQSDRGTLAMYPSESMKFQALKSNAANTAQVGYMGNQLVLAIAVPLFSVGADHTMLRGVFPLPRPATLSPSTKAEGDRPSYHVALIFPAEQVFSDSSNGVQTTGQRPSTATNPVLGQSLVAADGSGVVVNGKGQRETTAFIRMPSTGWYVLVHRPLERAINASDHLRTFVYKVAPFIAFIYLAIASLGLCYFLYPLARVARHADRMARGEIPLEPLPVLSQDEVGDLTAAFNRLLARLASQTTDLETQKELAEAAGQAKTRFLAAASHDLRQPMHAMNLYLGTLNSLPMSRAANDLVAQIRQCAQSMDDMFSSLLDISKLDTHLMQADLQVFPVATILEMIQSEFMVQAEQKGLVLTVKPCAALVYSDPEILLRILRNLVSNAVRYTENGRILVACRQRSAELQLSVCDTGPGIAAAQQTLVFEEFYQVDNPERDRSQGLGLGLAIVQRLARLLSSPIQLRSVLGHGSSFSLHLPLISATDRRTHLRHGFARHYGRSLTNAFVVILDDEEMVLDATRMLLEQWGCIVIAAESGDAMIKKLESVNRPPDAIICDHRLRGAETGVDVITALRAEFNLEIPALLVTGDTSPEKISGMAATGIRVLFKPLQDHALKESLSDLLFPG